MDNTYTDQNVTLHRGSTQIEIEILNFNESKITYIVKNVPIHTYDQHSRARIGVRFYDYKVSEIPVYSLYTEVYDKLMNNSAELNKFINLMGRLENQRNEIANSGQCVDNFNLMSRSCEYKVEQEYSSLKGQMARRLKLCEEEQIVSAHFILRKQMIEKGINQANNYLPGCDVTGECDYIAVSDHLSNCFGALFDACGRWDYDKTVYRSFNKSCTTCKMLKEQVNIDVPLSKYEIEQGIIR